MKPWLVLVALLAAPACSGTRQDQREGDAANRFAEHRGLGHADPHVARTASASGDEQGGWVSTICGGLWDLFFNSDTSTSPGP